MTVSWERKMNYKLFTTGRKYSVNQFNVMDGKLHLVLDYLLEVSETLAEVNQDLWKSNNIVEVAFEHCRH